MADIETQLNKLLHALAHQHVLPEIALGLDRVVACLERLGNPHTQLPPVVHIAGTNGKGSTQAMMRAMLEKAGKTVHVYSSPHLVRFHERIVLAGRPIPSDLLLNALLRVQEAAGETIPLTFFEATTIAAFLCFAETPADVVLLEVGLGGRLDATNVVDRPALCVITPIGYDHKEFLGDTLPAIAMEKAGIMKAGVPVVLAPQVAEVMTVLTAHARTLHCPVTFAEPLEMALSLAGVHQYVNAGTALAAMSVLEKNLGIQSEAYREGIAEAQWPGRLQRLSQGELLSLVPDSALWLDGGHNPAAGAALAEWLADMPSPGMVLGMMKRKDVEGFLAPFSRVLPIATVTIEGEGEAATAEMLAGVARRLGFKHVMPCLSLGEAVRWHADASLGPIKTILLCGSLYLAGKVLQNHA